MDVETLEKTACDALEADGLPADAALTDEDLVDIAGGSSSRKIMVDANPYVAHDATGKIIRRVMTNSCEL